MVPWGAAEKMSLCSSPIPSSSVMMSWLLPDFGISETCLQNWLRQVHVEDDARPGVTVAESADVRELRKRNRLLEQENEVLRRAAAYFAQAHLPGE